jgi:hypothetical protein
VYVCKTYFYASYAVKAVFKCRAAAARPELSKICNFEFYGDIGASELISGELQDEMAPAAHSGDR